MFTNYSIKKIWIAGLASTMMVIMAAPIAMAWNDDSRSNNRDGGGIVPPYMREKEARNDRDNNRNEGIVPPYLKDRVDSNRGRGW
jgi:hypothetical protein